MNRFRHFGLLLCLVIFNAQALENHFTLSEKQLHNLGIVIGKLVIINQIPLLYAPAKVVIPPTHEYIVSAAQAGLISRLNVALGDTVAKGQVLAMIKSPGLLTLQRQYLKTISDRSLAKATFERDKKLYEEGVISDRRWQETSTRYNSFVATANEVRQLLEIAGMSSRNIQQLRRDRRLSSQLTVRSPINGTVLQRMVVAGERIDILAPMYRIANLDQLWLEINIPQEKISSINRGDQVLIENTATVAQISLLGKSVDPVNQTILARAVIDGTQSSARAGQTVNTQIIKHSRKPVYKVPNVAIAQYAGSSYIFLRTQTGFNVKPVTILGKEEKTTIISGDFQGGEAIALRGAVALKANWLGLGSDTGDGN